MEKVKPWPKCNEYETPLEKLPNCPRCGEDELGMITKDYIMCYVCGFEAWNKRSG